MIELPNYNTQEWLINKSFIGEIWKDIPDYDGLYQVSNLGRVRSLDRTVKSSYGAVQNIKGKIIKYKNSRGYACVSLSKNGIVKYMRVHRLVALVFIPNPHNYPQINHKDCNPYNNQSENLEWCTQKYNNNYGSHNIKLSASRKMLYKNEDFRRKCSASFKNKWKNPTQPMISVLKDMIKKNCKRVQQINVDGVVVAVYNSTKDAFESTGILAQNIGQVCLGRQKTAGGFIWKYV